MAPVKIKNVSPFGDLDVPLLGRIVKGGEVVEVDEAHARVLLLQDFHYAPADKASKDILAALQTVAEPEGDEEPQTAPAPPAEPATESAAPEGSDAK